MDLTIPDDEYEAILKEIKSDSSPVGIDAGKTHVLILHKLLEIEQRLELLEASINEVKNDA